MKKKLNFERISDSKFEKLSKEECAETRGGLQATYCSILCYDPYQGCTYIDYAIVDDSPAPPIYC